MHLTIQNTVKDEFEQKDRLALIFTLTGQS